MTKRLRERTLEPNLTEEELRTFSQNASEVEREQLVRYQRAYDLSRSKQDALWWMRCAVWTSDQDTGQVRRFPYKKPHVAEVVDRLTSPYWTSVLIDKSRQMFITWTVASWALWDCMFHPVRLGGICKRTQGESEEIIWEKMKFIYDRIPGYLRPVEAKFKRQPPTIEFKNGSKVIGMSQDSDGLAGVTWSWFWFDEFARLWQARFAYTTVKPGLGRNGKMIGVWTPRGKNFPYQLAYKPEDL